MTANSSLRAKSCNFKRSRRTWSSPAEAADLTKKDLEGKPEDVSKEIIESELPEEQKTGDTKKDLITTATNLGIESVPAEAEIDEINKAIAGAKLGAALAGNYVNPNTGQAVRPNSRVTYIVRSSRQPDGFS